MSISVLIITHNEAKDLPSCLETVRWSDDVHVFDSLSSDETRQIALGSGCSFTARPFDNYASQRNAALHSLPFKYPWVLSLDADERVPSSLASEMRQFVATCNEDVVAARIRRKDIFSDTWLKHAQITPYYIRLVRPTRVHYEREINEVLVAHGNVATLMGAFEHYPFSKGISHWIEKHNRYSSAEASRALAERSNLQRFSFMKALFSGNPTERRVHQKGLYYRAPCRPLLKLIYMLLVRRAFLDGLAGINYALLQSAYELFIVLKEKELQAQPGDC